MTVIKLPTAENLPMQQLHRFQSSPAPQKPMTSFICLKMKILRPVGRTLQRGVSVM